MDQLQDENKLLRESIKKSNAEESDLKRKLCDLNKIVKATEKEKYNLQKRVENFLDTTKNLKENIADLKKEQKSADKSAKILEKKNSKEKEKFNEKIRNLELKISEQARSAEHSVKDSKSTMDSSSMSQRHLTISQVDAMMPNIRPHYIGWDHEIFSQVTSLNMLILHAYIRLKGNFNT